MQKKVGILSMQRVPNYGSFLQAWALKHILEELGAGASFIDIEPGRQLPGNEYRSGGVYRRRLRELAAALFTGRLGEKLRSRTYNRAMRRRYPDEYYALLGLDAPAPERYDLAVIGSDQVFNSMEVSPWGFTTQLFGNIPQADRVISYAASFGSSTWEAITRAGIAEEIAANLGRLDAVSVRDDDSWELVLKLTGREAEKHLDPVLVYDFSEELEGRSSGRRDYILIYSYPERICDPAEVAAIREFAARNGKKLVSILAHYHWCDESVIPATPFDVVAWFRDADHVVTDTFHGAVFSIITRSNFCTLVRDSNSGRLASLLGWLGQESRAAATPGDIARTLDTEPDYTLTTRIIEREKVRARTYLRRALTE